MNYSEYACMFILSGFSKSKNNNGYDINVPGSKISKFTKWLCENRGVNGFLCGNEIDLIIIIVTVRLNPILDIQS